MKKTIDINIAGQLFRIDEDAWSVLKHYLGHVAARFSNEQGGEETLADIEARIAEIFGGGGDPPTLVSKEMVDNMINIMGAPEDYYDDSPASENKTVYRRKSMYDPNSPSARLGKFLSEFFTAFGKVMSAIIRVLAIIFGSIFTLVGFILFFTFVLVIFFTNAPILTSVMEPELTNTHMLLSIALNSSLVWPVLILTALIILIPLAGLTWLGIKMIFNIRERFKTTSIVLFVVWVASLCALGVFLGLQLAVYATHENIEKRISLDPAPKVIWIAPAQRLSDISWDETASVNWFKIYHERHNDKLYATADLNIRGNDNGSGFISVERKAFSNSDLEARDYAREIEFNWKFSGDTLYLDEFYSLPSGNRWAGSWVDIDISLPEGTEVRCVEGSSLATWMFRIHDDDISRWRIEDGYLRKINE